MPSPHGPEPRVSGLLTHKPYFHKEMPLGSWASRFDGLTVERLLEYVVILQLRQTNVSVWRGCRLRNVPASTPLPTSSFFSPQHHLVKVHSQPQAKHEVVRYSYDGR